MGLFVQRRCAAYQTMSHRKHYDFLHVVRNIHDMPSIAEHGADSVGMVRFPSGWCFFRRDGAFPVGMVHFPSGWCIFRRGGAFSVGSLQLISDLVKTYKLKLDL